MPTKKPGSFDSHNLREIELKSHPPNLQAARPHDPLVQTVQGTGAIPSPLNSFDGVGDLDGVQPADMGLDVSDSQMINWVNLSFQVMDKSGNVLSGPFEGSQFWSGLGGNCDAPNNGGDILVRWDQFASQWVVAQLSYTGSSFDLCVAVSQTSDATGAYYQYDFLYSPTAINDYPKMGLWPDPTNNGYYFTARDFAGGVSFTGMTIQALDRAKLLNGTADSTSSQIFALADLGGTNGSMDGLLPADLRGTQMPASGSLETYISVGSPQTDGSATTVLHLYQTNVDFTTPANSTLVQLPDLPSADFDNALTGAPQVGGGALEVIAGFGQSGVLYRADYRLFADHDSLLLYHDVNVSGTCGAGEQGGFRWHEVRGIAIGGPPTLYQEGTYGPCDGTYRWMGSLAQDVSGDIAVGFSASSGGGGIVIDPSVHYTGRLASDPLGTMGQGEDTFFDSVLPFGGFRWGDYSTTVVDPVDQCTFWYSAMYGAGDWATRIGSFKFDSCSQGPTGTLEGTVDDGTNPIAGATVTANLASTTTNGAGHYTFLLPIGSYDMTASKYGFLPASALGVAVTDGGDTIQNFSLSPAPSVLVNGIVKDASGGGWPLYAKIVITGNGAPTFTIYTDPVTGYYSQTLVQGITYTFTITAVSGGYNTGGGPLPLTVTAPIVKNWDLTVNASTCNAPGYSLATSGLSESFDGGVVPPGWTLVTNSGNPWSVISSDPCGDFVNQTGGTGPFAASNSNCDGNILDDNELRTPAVDMSALSSPVIQFNEDYHWLFDNADVDISTNDGATWTNVLAQSTDTRGPRQITVDISGLAAGQSSVMARFHNYNAFFAWWWAVDNVLLGEAACEAGAGGLVVGNVLDSNTGAGLNGAKVTNLTSGGEATTFATPLDPNQPDGLYILFSESGPQSFEATANKYGTQDKNALVIPNSTIRVDFSLASGVLDASPRPMSSKINPGETDEQTLTITNTGGNDGAFAILEQNTPLALPLHGKPTGRLQWLQRPGAGVSMTSNTAHSGLAHPSAAVWHPGKPAGSQPTILVYADDFVHTSPNTYIDQALQSLGLTYTAFYDGNFAGFESALNGGGWDVVLYGNENFFPPQSTLDALNTFATGGGKIILDCWAFGQYLGHPLWTTLGVGFVGNDGEPPDAIYWWDPANPVFTFPDTVPQFTQLQGGIYGVYGQMVDPLAGFSALAGYTTPGPDAGQAALVIGSNGLTMFRGFADGQNNADLDSDGVPDGAELWTNLINGIVNGFSSDIPWVSEDPTEGTVPANGSFPVAVTFDSTGLRPGLRQAQLTFTTDTPSGIAPVGLNFTVRFLDVLDNNPPGTDPFENFIYGAAGAGIMAGSPYPGCHPGELNFFCPSGLVTRADMAGYIFRAVHGPFSPPPVYTGIFGDVLFNDYNADYIQGVWDDGITAGCQADPLLYCPGQSIPRGQMAVFIEKGVRGTSFVPPACSGYFGDVACPPTPEDPYGDWVELLFNDGITAGCQTDPPLFCPLQQIPNEQMATFLVKAFGLPVLP